MNEYDITSADGLRVDKNAERQFGNRDAIATREFLYKESGLMATVVLCAFVVVSLLYYNLPFLGELFPPTLLLPAGLR